MGPHYAERRSLSDSTCWDGGKKWVKETKRTLELLPRGRDISHDVGNVPQHCGEQHQAQHQLQDLVDVVPPGDGVR